VMEPVAAAEGATMSAEGGGRGGARVAYQRRAAGWVGGAVLDTFQRSGEAEEEGGGGDEDGSARRSRKTMDAVARLA
jgi:hypothetical protein